MKIHRFFFAAFVFGAMAANAAFAGQGPAPKVAAASGKPAPPPGGGHGASSVNGTAMRAGGSSAGINGTAVRPAVSTLNGSTVRGKR